MREPGIKHRLVRKLSDQVYNGTPRAFEKYATEVLLRDKNFLRTDYKNQMPDFMEFKDGKGLAFYECKRYVSCAKTRTALSRWQDKQPGQAFQFRHMLGLGFTVYMVLAIKTGIYLLQLEEETWSEANE